MTIFTVCGTLRDSRAFDWCCRFLPCLSDPARRSALGLKVALVTLLHLIYAGVLFLFNEGLIEKLETEPWYTGTYLTLFVIALVQYLVTSGSSPGYVLDAMRTVNEANSATVSKQPAASSKGSVVVTVGGSYGTPWRKLVMDLYPLGTPVSICSKCNAEQPPRSKHCRDCERCVLQFDHHCPSFGICIGVGNRFKYWCYICEETALCLWTGILYITYLKTSDISSAWWKDAIMIVLLVPLSIVLLFLLFLLLFHSYLILTNQTTDEYVRRRRITYFRGIPERVYPFSKGACRNLYEFCCLRSSKYRMESVPTVLELEEKARPYTCTEVVTCRCC
ncbi:PREDICTED: protein S-acyltransferase 10-like [Fragaria vesca subsp. vesca]|uniref:protein S-acyltransferase 10-like n=1 Tax=Fragaria vesca subsp. vesca TaxID=101020 RepID=UPI0002C37261|nr:PREDICTED: protein S-acyltransferase 10-like [Fragaria vesca subsp. vesca]